jgi:hypothetical protein
MDPHEPAFLEIVLESKDFTLDSRDAVEDPLHDALTAAGIGEVTGAGGGMGKATSMWESPTWRPVSQWSGACWVTSRLLPAP